MGQKQLIGNREKALLHIGKAQLGMSEEAYRDMLGSVGASSSKELDLKGYNEIMGRLKAAGFRPTHKSAKRSGMHRRPPGDKELMLSKIGAILADLKLPWSYADGMARKMFGVERLIWLNGMQTYRLLQALITYQQRRGLHAN